ncbi:ankyrin repeat domain-containing protein [Endozoicomonas sp. ONNA2]|uniref:ankyrin repeat domain-containing protein n=1 Tax=Endozoicomonas sp. ONNA2 TaxID=2828741 RepID=UPI002147686E|nr:ankyrin repeat domain-containing protein [Endozoicomonas sp. ONNA2]
MFRLEQLKLEERKCCICDQSELQLLRNGNALPIDACISGDLYALEKILGHNPQIINRYPDLIWSAAYNGKSECLKLMLNTGLDINAQDSQGQTPLFRAVLSRKLSVVKLLLDEGANANLPCLKELEVNVRGLAKLLDRNADINAKTIEKRLTPLQMAACLGHIDIVDVLLDADDIQVNDRDDVGGFTALHLAATNDRAEIVKLLVDAKGVKKGIKVNEKNDDGYTALCLAIYSYLRDIKTVEALLTSDDIDVNEIDNEGRTALHLAVAKGYKEIVDKLLEVKGIDANKKDKNGETALHYAAKSDHAEIVKLLVGAKGVNKGIKVNEKNCNGDTALCLAAFLGHLKTVMALLASYDIDVNEITNDGRTALHLAAGKGYVTVW